MEEGSLIFNIWAVSEGPYCNSKEASMVVPPFVYRLACLCFCLFLINYPNMQTNNTSWIFFLG
jgi:hypothetical protein